MYIRIRQVEYCYTYNRRFLNTGTHISGVLIQFNSIFIFMFIASFICIIWKKVSSMTVSINSREVPVHVQRGYRFCQLAKGVPIWIYTVKFFFPDFSVWFGSGVTEEESSLGLYIWTISPGQCTGTLGDEFDIIEDQPIRLFTHHIRLISLQWISEFSQKLSVNCEDYDFSQTQNLDWKSSNRFLRADMSVSLNSGFVVTINTLYSCISDRVFCRFHRC